MLEWLERRRNDIFPSGSLRARLAKGISWSLVGTVILRGLKLTAFVAAARLLGQVGFGELGMINSTVGMFGIFAGMGLGLTATKHVAELRTKDPGRTGRILGLSMWAALVSGGAISLVLFAIAPLLAARVLNAPHLADELRLGCGLLFFNALNGAQLGALSGFEAFKTVARVNLVPGLLSIPMMVVGILLLGLPGAVGAMVLLAATGCWINQRALRQECRSAGVIIKYRGIRPEWGVLWQFSLPAFLSDALLAPVTWAANAMLVNQPNGYAEMGLFNAAWQWRGFAVFIPKDLRKVMLPVLSSLYGEQDVQGYRKAFWGNLAAVLAVGLAVAVPIVLASRVIMSAYGAGFSEGANVLVVLVLGAVLPASTAVVLAAISSMGKMWYVFLLNCSWTLALVLFTPLFVTRGAFGLSLAHLLSYATHFSVSCYVFMTLNRSIFKGRRSN